MATLYPGAQYRPLGQQTQPRMAAHDIVCLHTMVGSLTGTDAYFRDNGYGGTESHFGVGHDGTVYQWQDLEHTADANLEGNHRVISIETADTGLGFPGWSGSDVPAWLSAQLNALARLIAWLCDHYRIPAVAILDSQPGRRGIGTHRDGIDPWRVPAGEHWSTSKGKACPGDRRVAQMPALIRAAALMTVPSPEDDMPLTPADVDLVAKATAAATVKAFLAAPLRDLYPEHPSRDITVGETLQWAAANAGRALDAARRSTTAGDPAAFATAVAVELAARLKEK